MCESAIKYVWAISSGEYSDYQVKCVCSSEKEADKLAAKLNEEETYEKYDVEKFMICDSAIEKNHILVMNVRLRLDSGTEDQKFPAQVLEEWPFERETVACKWVWSRSISQNYGWLNVEGTDHELVRKVFSEKMAMFMADASLRSETNLSGTFTDRNRAG